MTLATVFRHTPHQNPATPARIAEILADPGFGKHVTDHMVTIDFDPENGWHDGEIRPYEDLRIAPCANVLNYGQAIFEGLKAYRQPDGSVATFRPEANAARFRDSARRLAMPELPEDLFVSSLSELIAVEDRWIPAGDGQSLYLRPLMIATSTDLLVTPGTEYTYVVVALPSGPYFTGGVTPVSVWLSREYVRAAPGGTGAAKFAGNYAGTFVAQAQAKAAGCDQVVWLDAVERRWIEEMGGMNLFFVFGSGTDARVVTPGLTGTLLPGVTRDSVLRLATDLGLAVEERRVSTEEWQAAAASGALTEVFACGTAAVITPVGAVRHSEGGFTVADGEPGPVTMRLRDRLTGIQEGRVPDPYGWMRGIG
ncbi:branched-chain amino acid aminotransferase [Actinophytocola sp.]|uniref:branched-chain amino acid aminotransferase n=1 Tax=Actinophytocola sp. TaxID=1872138 RepID=UPI003D6B50EF